MGRMNNTSRSLIIISKANGWDPTEIHGDSYNYNEDRVKVGDSRTIPSNLNDPNTIESNLGFTDKDFQVPDHPTQKRTTNANPYPGFGKF